MSTPLAVTVALLTASLGACTCGGFSGGGDRVLARGSDMLILCDNSGFYANVTGGQARAVVEGRFTTDGTGVVTGAEGDTRQRAFTLTWNGDGTATTQAGDLGDGAWTLNDLNQVELDHANIMCTDLVSRSWWTVQ
jgi:hypothetical protein